MAELTLGAKTPAFSLKDQSENTVSLKDFKGRKVLIYFYPKADTPGCTKQSCAISENLTALNDLNVDAVGISPDKPEAQAKFDTKFDLGFPLLADEDHAVADAFGVWGEKSMYGNKYMGIIRSAFLVDENGKIEQAWYKVSPSNTVPNVLKALAS